ncbi:hypothetical protein GCM10009745_57240 [Kribbella yunnanensis]|uniref:FxLD family lantipeptide n=1 Tax=Kribbella yunnanensis TaxID=190194 RepID=A0ABP4UBL7_9ACTN
MPIGIDEFDLDIRLTERRAHEVKDPVTVHTTRPTGGGPCCTDFCCPG